MRLVPNIIHDCDMEFTLPSHLRKVHMRYHIFQGAGYYPESGCSDYVKSFDHENEAVDFFEEIKHQDDWTYIIIDNGERLQEYEGYWRP